MVLLIWIYRTLRADEIRTHSVLWCAIAPYDVVRVHVPLSIEKAMARISVSDLVHYDFYYLFPIPGLVVNFAQKVVHPFRPVPILQILRPSIWHRY